MGVESGSHGTRPAYPLILNPPPSFLLRRTYAILSRKEFSRPMYEYPITDSTYCSRFIQKKSNAGRKEFSRPMYEYLSQTALTAVSLYKKKATPAGAMRVMRMDNTRRKAPPSPFSSFFLSPRPRMPCGERLWTEQSRLESPPKHGKL